MNGSELTPLCHDWCVSKGVTTRTAVNSHLCVMTGASVALNQSQHIGVSHYLPMWLRPKAL